MFQYIYIYMNLYMCILADVSPNQPWLIESALALGDTGGTGEVRASNVGSSTAAAVFVGFTSSLTSLARLRSSFIGSAGTTCSRGM